VSDWLSEQLPDGLPLHVVRHVESVNIDHLTCVSGDFGLQNLLFSGFELVHGGNHSRITIAYAKSKV
jgi:hypothetical protein